MVLKPEGTIAQIQSILRFAHALRDAAGVSPYPSHPPIAHNCGVAIGSITLPDPPPLLPHLLDVGLSHEIAVAASKIYESRSAQLRRHIQESIITACREIAELPTAALASAPDSFIRSVVSAFTGVYLHRLRQWKEEVIQRIKPSSRTTTIEASKNSRTFNHEYVPLLEHFFEENPFPTHADKMFLAKKSNMQYKQIHVWFQNRRNRSKKEGTILKKKPTYEGATRPLDKLRAHMYGPESYAPQPSKTGSLKGTAQSNMSNDTFASTSPPHAFPSPYPHTCHSDPFPCKNGPVHFSKPKWERVPDRGSPLSLSTSIDDLVDKFSRLNVRDGTRSKGSPQSQSHAATVAITVIPSRAPHPSLIVSQYSPQANVIRLIPSVHAPVFRPKAFHSPSPTSKPVSLIPLSAPPNKRLLPEQRKITPLPQRLPGQTQHARRDTMQSEGPSTPSSSPRLFSTDTESCSCSLSSVSSLSTPEDIANTRELPPLFGSPCRSLLDSPIHLWGLRDTVAISPSSVT